MKLPLIISILFLLACNNKQEKLPVVGTPKDSKPSRGVIVGSDNGFWLPLTDTCRHRHQSTSDTLALCLDCNKVFNRTKYENPLKYKK